MKKLISLMLSVWFCAVLFFYFNPKIVTAAVIFSEDFSQWNNGKNYNYGTAYYRPNIPDGLGSNGWAYLDSSSSDTYNEVAHYGGEISHPGRKGTSDMSLKIWRHGTFNFGYISDLHYWSDALFSAGREIYTRWYMKIPSDFEVSCSSGGFNYLKLWRNVIGAQSGCVLPNWCAPNAIEIYVMFYGADTFSESNFCIGPSVRGDYSAYTPGFHFLSPIADFRDGLWHCHEIRMKINTPGLADAEFEYLRDGVRIKLITGMDWRVPSGWYWSKSGLGIGNTGARDCSPQGGFQEPWRAIEFDDYVISTTYVGPEGNNPSPSPPTGLKIVP